MLIVTVSLSQRKEIVKWDFAEFIRNKTDIFPGCIMLRTDYYHKKIMFYKGRQRNYTERNRLYPEKSLEDTIMKELFNRNVTNLAPSASIQFMAKAKQMQEQGLNVINLAGGEPDFPTPAPIVEEACRQLHAGFTHYTVGQGLPELRSRIARKLREENGVSYADDEILVTPGGKNAIYLAISTLVNPGDEVMYLDPAWVSYVPMIQANGGVAVPVVLDYDNDYRITPEALEAGCTPRTKLLIINYPNNPTGKLLSRQEAEILERFLLAHPEVILLSDEIYERIVFDGKTTVSPAAFPAIRDRVITVNGFSKSVAMTGWRLGYMAAPRPIARQVYKLYQHSITCVSGFMQKAATVALDCAEEIEAMRRSYETRRDLFFAKLNAIEGVEARLPEGAFYAWVKIEKKDMDSFALCNYLLEEALVVGVPGDAYGKGGGKCLRFSFATDLDSLLEAADRMKLALDRL